MASRWKKRFRRVKDRVKGFAKRTRNQLSELDTDLKRITRKAAVPLAKAQPFISAGVSTALSAFFSPLAGYGYAALEGFIARPLGATAARAEGESGREAREAGRDQQKKVAAFGAAGATLGTLYSVLLAPATAPAAPSSATSAVAAGAKSGATAGAAAGAGQSSSVLSAFLGGAASGAAGSVVKAGGGILGTLGSIGETLLTAAPTILSAYDKLKPQSVPSGFDLTDLLALAGLEGGGAGAGLGAGEAGAGEEVAPGSSVGLPTWVKVTAGGAVLVGGYGLYRLMNKGKAA